MNPSSKTRISYKVCRKSSKNVRRFSLWLCEVLNFSFIERKYWRPLRKYNFLNCHLNHSQHFYFYKLSHPTITVDFVFGLTIWKANSIWVFPFMMNSVNHCGDIIPILYFLQMKKLIPKNHVSMNWFLFMKFINSVMKHRIFMISSEISVW